MDRKTYRRVNSEYGYITPINIALAAINIVVFIVMSCMEQFAGNMLFRQYLTMFPPAVLDGQWYRLITSSFIHFGPEHLFNNMIMFICLGSYLEKALGKIKYLIFFFVSAVGSSLVSMFHMLNSQDLALSGGASGVVFAMIGALLYMVIRNKGRFQNLTLKRFMIMIVLSLYFGFASAGVDNAAHIGGLCVGFILSICLYRKNR